MHFNTHHINRQIKHKPCSFFFAEIQTCTFIKLINSNGIRMEDFKCWTHASVQRTWKVKSILSNVFIIVVIVIDLARNELENLEQRSKSIWATTVKCTFLLIARHKCSKNRYKWSKYIQIKRQNVLHIVQSRFARLAKRTVFTGILATARMNKLLCWVLAFALHPTYTIHHTTFIVCINIHISFLWCSTFIVCESLTINTHRIDSLARSHHHKFCHFCPFIQCSIYRNDMRV